MAGLSKAYRFRQRRAYTEAPASTFDAALMAAIAQKWPVTVISPPQVVASGMTPPNQLPN